MRKLRSGAVLVMAVLGLSLLGDRATFGQNGNVAFQAVVGQPPGVPDLPPQGAWGEVINVTNRWLVIQNHIGQQFPIAIEDIQEFLVRWPTSVNDLAPNGQSMLEAVGQDVGSNVVRVNHVDVFNGENRTLVAPAYNSLLPSNMVVTTLDPGFNRFMNAWDYGGQNMLYGWAYPVPTNMTGIPAKLHVVGNAIKPTEPGQPIVLGLPGNNSATVVPDDSGQFTMTEVTRGTSDMVRKGDYAFLLPLQTAPRGLIVSQLVIYKQVSVARFRADRGLNGNGNNAAKPNANGNAVANPNR